MIRQKYIFIFAFSKGHSSLELTRPSAKFRKIRHSRRIRRIFQNRRFVGTPISSSIALWRNFVKFAILAEFAGFVKIAAFSVTSLELNHSSAKFCQIRHCRRIRQNRRFVGTPISSSIALRRNFVKIRHFNSNIDSPLRGSLDIQYRSNVSYHLSSRFSRGASRFSRDASRFSRDASRFSRDETRFSRESLNRTFWNILLARNRCNL